MIASVTNINISFKDHYWHVWLPQLRTLIYPSRFITGTYDCLNYEHSYNQKQNPIKLLWDTLYRWLVQDCSISIAKALEILQPCTKPSLWSTTHGSVVVHPFHLHSLFRHHNKHCVGGTRRYHTAFVCKDDSLQMKYSILFMMICAHHVGTQATILKTPPRFKRINFSHYSDIIMGTMASQSPASRLFTQPFIQGTDQRKHQSSRSLAFERGIHRWPVNSSHKWPVMRKMCPFHDVMMGKNQIQHTAVICCKLIS